MTEHPAPPFQRDLAVDLLKQIEHAGRGAGGGDRPDVILGAMKQDVLDLLPRQASVVIESGPSGVGRRRRAQLLRRTAADIDIESGHLEPVIAERGSDPIWWTVG